MVKRMKMFRFKFNKKKNTKNEEFDIFEGQGRGEKEGDLHFKNILPIIIGKHMKMFFFQI